MALRERIHRLRRNQSVQDIADSLGVPVETVLAIQQGTASSLPPAPGGVNRSVAERLDELTIPADYAGDPYVYGIEGAFTPTPGALISALWTFEVVAASTRSWQWFMDHNGNARQVTSGQTNQSAASQPLHMMEMACAPPGAATTVMFWRPRVDGETTIRTGLKQNSGATGQTGSAIIKNQRLYFWEMAPDGE